MASDLEKKIKSIDQAIEGLRPSAKAARAAVDLYEVLEYVSGSKKLIDTMAKERKALDEKYVALQKEHKDALDAHAKTMADLDTQVRDDKATKQAELDAAAAQQKKHLGQLAARRKIEEAKLDDAKARTAEIMRLLSEADAKYRKREGELNALHEQEAKRRTNELAKLEGQISLANAELNRIREKIAV